jgi:hypothetical protein
MSTSGQSWIGRIPSSILERLVSADDIARTLARRLPALPAAERKRLADAYLKGALDHAKARTTGSGPVPTALGAERAELLAHVCRALGRLLSEDEIRALLRVPPTTGRTLRTNMLALYDDLPALALKAAFAGARRDGRGSIGDIKDGYRVRFPTAESIEIARQEVDRQGFLWEVAESSGSRHVLLIDPAFPIAEANLSSK